MYKSAMRWFFTVSKLKIIPFVLHVVNEGNDDGDDDDDDDDEIVKDPINPKCVDETIG